MADVNISKYRASVVRSGSAPATPGFVVSEGQNPVEPAGSEQNHLPVTINATATGLAITTDQVLSGAGTVGQYIRGDGSLADFPASTGGGSSVSYYLNGSISQGTIGGVAYKELSKTPILGAGTQFTINADGYIASFLTDAGDPNLLEIPGGNWNFETYFSASSGGGSPTFYVELYKYDGSTFTLIASNSGSPELIAFGTNVNSYFSTLAVPTTALTLTDRLAIRYYVTHSGRTITLHTENNTLCQIITTFTTGLTALNGLTAQVQYFAVGTSGTDFNIASATQTHTFNLPTASASNRGALSSADWSTFNAKQNALTLTTTGSSGASTLVGATLNVPTYTLSGLGGVPTSRQLTINGTAFDLSADRSWSVGTVTSVGLSSATSGVTIGNTPVTGSGTITLAIATATSTQQGLLSSTDWSTFNNKQNTITLTTTGTSGAATLVGSTLNIPQYQSVLTNPITGTGTTNYLAKFTGSTTVGNSQLFDNGTNVGIGTASPDRKLGILVSPSATGDDGINITNGSTPFILTRTGASYTYRGVAANAGMIYSSSNIALLADGSNITFHNGNGQVASIQSNGNLLVGTTSDNGAKLQVSGNSSFNGGLNTYHVVSIKSNGALTYQGLGVYSSSNDRFISMNHTGTEGFIETENAGSGVMTPLSFKTGGTTRLTIASTGAATFSSSVTAANFNAVSSNAFIIINDTSGNAAGQFQFQNNGIQKWNFATQATSNDLGLYNNGGTNSFNLYIKHSTGNVGIGTTSPYANLDLGASGANNIILRNTTNAYNLGYIGNSSGRIDIGFSNSNSSLVPLPYLSVNSSGNVLIGTTTDSGDRVNVNGSIRVPQTFFFRYDGDTGLIGSGSSITGGSASQLGIRAASDILFATNGANERMRITSSGNVGIGTSSPVYTLDVRGRIYAGTALLIGESGSGYSLIESTGGNGIWLRPNGVSSPSGMFLTTAGNVGIGTSNPSYKLQIRNDVAASTSLEPISLGLYNNSDGGAAIYFQNAVGGQSKISFGVESTGAGTDDSYLGFSTGANTSLTERMRITSGGNVLIGTTTDFPFLGTTSLNVDRNFNSGHNIRISNQANNSSASANLILGTFGNSWVNGLGSNSSTLGNNLYWAVDASTSPLQYKMVLTTSGNLLIGTTTDVTGANLNVNGNIRTAAPTGGNAANWRLGTARAGTITPNAIVRIEIAGVLVDLDARYV